MEQVAQETPAAERRGHSHAPLDIPALSERETAEAIVGRLERLVRRVRRASTAQLCDLSVTPGQLRVLKVLRRSKEPLRVKDLAERLDIVPRSATSAIDDLERAGLVSRSADPADRRAIRVSLTDDGVELLGTVKRRRRDATVSLLADLSPAERKHLLGLLDRLVPDHHC